MICVQVKSWDTDRQLETIEINKSLSALGDVIEALDSLALTSRLLPHDSCFASCRRLQGEKNTSRTGPFYSVCQSCVGLVACGACARNHKLTQLLQDALGGTAKAGLESEPSVNARIARNTEALMCVNCSPAQSSIRETAGQPCLTGYATFPQAAEGNFSQANSLKLANRAKRVVPSPDATYEGVWFGPCAPDLRPLIGSISPLLAPARVRQKYIGL